MMKLILTLIFTFLSCHLWAVDLTAQRQTELLNLLTQDCGSCHGMTLKGGLGPPLLPANLAGKPKEFIILTILKGRPKTPMPPWQGLLTEPEIDWLVNKLYEGIDHVP